MQPSAAEGAGRQRPLTREIDPVDGLVREVVAGHGEQQERADYDQRSGQQDLALPMARFGQPRRRILNMLHFMQSNHHHESLRHRGNHRRKSLFAFIRINPSTCPFFIGR